MERKEFCCCGRTKKHLPYCPLDEVGVDSLDIAEIERTRKKIKKAVKKKICACALANGHFQNCPYKNQAAGEESKSDLEIKFGILRKMMEEMVKKYEEEKSLPLEKRKRIFIAPVIKKRKKKAAD